METDETDEQIAEKKFDIDMDGQATNVRPRVKKTVPKEHTSGLKYISLAGELGFDIALPMAAGLIIGVKLDAYWGTQPRMTIGLFVLGLVISCASLIRIVQDVNHKR
jgi:F0F1-type ATP synthase assembly protein I